MVARVIGLVGVCGVSLFCSAQYWATKATGLGNERFTDVCSGPGDVLFSTGEFGPGSTVAGQVPVSTGLSDIFVLKQNAAGAVQWLVRAGGPGLDLAGRLCAAPDGSVVVCGQFQGTADLFGSTVIAQGGSTDLFVAKLSGTDGSLVWVRTGGSAAYTDRAAGVAVGADGRVLLTGEFRGTAVFDAGTFSSMIDPDTSTPGSDVFVASYAPDGAAQWLVHGEAPHDDRAADVTVDASGAAYAVGTYSETISFGIPHPNTALNQMYLLKVDAAGQEQWFRRIGGAAYQLPVDLQLGDNGSLYFCGDNQGALTWFGDTQQTIPSAQPKAYFLIKAGSNGDLQQSSTTGSANAVHATGLDQRGTTVAILGTFQCAFEDLQQHYAANGIFIAVGTEDLFIAEHDATTTSINEAQQFGGHEEKLAGAITSLSNGELVFCGAFAELLNFPSESSDWGEDLEACPPAVEGAPVYCGDDHYTTYASILSGGGLDGFIARGYVGSRQPYDPFVRHGNVCDRQIPEMTVLSEPGVLTDNVVQCGGDTLFWPHEIHRPACPYCVCDPARTISWNVDEVWSTGASDMDTIHAWSTGWYWRTQTASNGCYTSTDSIHLTVLPAPIAWASLGGAPAFPGPFNVFSICEVPTTLETNNLQPGYTFQWFVNGTPVGGSVIPVTGSGVYTLVVTAPNGCTGTNQIPITVLSDQDLPNITDTDFQFSYMGVPFDEQDTILVCAPGTCMSGDLLTTWYVDGTPTVLTQPIFAEYGTIGGCGSNNVYPNQGLFWNQVVQTDGWYPLHVHITLHVEGCGDDTLAFDVFDSVYFHIAAPEIVPVGDVVLCLGDTLAVPVHCTGCTEMEITGPPGMYSVSPGQDTVLVWGLGGFLVIGTNTQGAFCKDFISFQVVQAQPPPITVEPVLVCPGDTALLWTSFLSNQYDWIGPDGPLQGNNDSIFVSMPGTYYLTAYTDQGCALFNGPAYVNQFATPSLSMQPDNVLCPGETGALEILGGGIPEVQWNPPFSGSGLVQLVDSAGTYSCLVTACGTQLELNAEVVSSSVSVSLDPGPFSICGGGSVLLDGPTGDYTYFWVPGGGTTEDLLVFAPGDYTLQVTDGFGCTATSDAATVLLQNFTQPLEATGDSICAGDTLVLSATGSGTITWYADEALTDPLATGAAYIGGGQLASDTLYVTQTEGDCTGPALPVVVSVGPTPGTLVISGDTLLCEGDDLSLFASASGATFYQWATPQGTASTQSYTLNSIGVGASGAYVCLPLINACPGSPAAVVVLVQSPPAVPVISGASALCEGEPLVLHVNGSSGEFTWYGPDGAAIGAGPDWSGVAQNGEATYTVVADGGTCPDVQGSFTVLVDDCSIIIPNIFTPNGDGQNDQFILEGGATTAFHLRLFNRWGQEVRFIQATQHLSWDGRDEDHQTLPDGVYYFELMELRSGQTIPHTGYIQLSRGR
ncbi:MAG TPA: gliding motility-associated C-terminal domain-containing protein [Flavobacteriales bacterium]|nr:gliding motility-associated C-terminal domain-containing protein [Flavobacteriales bacterium]